MPSGLLILDRDGVLDRMLVDGAGMEESPLRVEDVDVFPWVAQALKSLCDANFGVCLATNQPAAAKGKTTRQSLEAVHRRILAEATASGAVILGSYICWHRAEDRCRCRKPKTGLLEDALREHPAYAASGAWMVGDRATDVLAGKALGLKTALLTERAVDPSLRPDFAGPNLEAFARFLLSGLRNSP